MVAGAQQGQGHASSRVWQQQQEEEGSGAPAAATEALQRSRGQRSCLGACWRLLRSRFAAALLLW